MTRYLKISKDEKIFVVEDSLISGSPPVGRGRTMMEAVGSWFHNNQNNLGFQFMIEESAWPAEKRRRIRELTKR